jgi:hypothetical protein
MKRLTLLALGAALLAPSGAAIAQEDSQPSMYFVLQEYVKASMLQEYEALMKEMIGELTAAGVTDAQFITISGPELGYAYVMQVEGFAGIDATHQAWEAAIAAVGPEKFMEMHGKFGEMMDHSAASVIMLREDLSYLPETVAITGDTPFRQYYWYYTIPGKELAMEAVAREYAALYESKGIESGWRIYQVMMGPDLPAYLVVLSAESEAAFIARSSEIEELLGDEVKELFNKSMKATRRLEVMEGWVRPDLSYPQPTATSTK